MVYSKFFRVSVWLLTSILFLLYPLQSSFSQAREHSTRTSISPCGNPNTQLENLTGFFEYKWKATYFDLGPVQKDNWIKHYGFEDRDIALVRVFQSPAQPTLAVVAARRFQNFLDGKLLVDVFCIILAEKNAPVRSYEPEELEQILLGPGSDT
ncbi:MAG: hypothetical protein CME71_11800 [Halobacteriovorax sp.]|nr:hypothetical protein [Halobacteriovorax sp.]|tara:strand:- start:10818 stop:11276 length:459 start_codon:yes stop_codon:yes gene_type:complete